MGPDIKQVMFSNSAKSAYLLVSSTQILSGLDTDVEIFASLRTELQRDNRTLAVHS